MSQALDRALPESAPAGTGAAAGGLAVLLLGLAATALAVAAAPLAVYGLVIAFFGLPHVLAELRFLDLRYSGRLQRTVIAPLLAILAAACLMRVAGSYGWLPRSIATPTELLLVAGSALPLQRCLGGRRWVSWAAMAGIAGAAAVAPFHTLLLLSVAHNLTPAAFIGQALRGWPAAACAGVVIFVVLPLAIVAGLGGPFVGALGIGLDPEATVMPTGPLARSIGTAVPAEITDGRLALGLFAAAVYLQCVHYVCVIHIMPRLLPGSGPAPRRLLGWPGHGRMRLALIAIGTLTGLAFLADFGEARRVYAVIAAFHSWLEVPILLLMLAGGLRLRPAAG